MKWYKHDSNANCDAKLRKVRLKYGMEGYGLYWYCLELIAQNVDHNNLTFELEHDAEIISADTNIHYELVQEMMTYMVDLGLFEQTEGIITCLKLAQRTDEYTAKIIRNLPSVPTVSRQCPDKVPPIRIDKIRTDKNIRATKRVPAKWKFSDEAAVFAIDAGMNEAEALEQLAQFRDHEYKYAKKDWDAAWRTWCRNWKKWRKDETPHARPDSFDAIHARTKARAGLD